MSNIDLTVDTEHMKVKGDMRTNAKTLFDKFIGKQDISLLYQKIKFSEEELDFILLEIFNGEEILNSDNTILNEDVLIDLEVFNGLGTDRENSIYSGINKCKTQVGSFLLQKILNNPVNDTNILRKRQSMIKRLETHENIEEIKNKLDRIKENENDILNLWKTLDNESKNLYDMVYFENRFLKFFNKNELVLRLYNYYVIIFSPIYGILTPILMVLSPFIMIKFYFKKEISFRLYFRLLRVALSGFSNIFKVSKDMKGLSDKIGMGQMVTLLLWLVFYLHALFSNMELAKNTNKITNIIHEKLNKISILVREGHNLNDLLGDEVEGYSKIVDYKVDKNFGILWDKIFEEKPSLFSNKGRVLKTFKCLQERKENLIDLLKSIGNIDYYVGLVDLKKNYENTSNKYCYPEYLELEKPVIMVDNLWYPLLKNKVVTNSINIGGDMPHNAIITGPNAGGKSTFLKSLTLNLLFAQTIGICSSENLRFTPFSIINTYLNIPDCKGKESLFEAEMRRSLGHINKLNNLNKKDFSFVIMDEIFSSTNPDEGVSGAYAIAKKMSGYDNSISLITTHYGKISDLEKVGKFKNYKIPIERDENNQIVYKYKLEEGVSNQFIALELLKKKGFDNDIVDVAMEMCTNISEERKGVNDIKEKTCDKDEKVEETQIIKKSIEESLIIKEKVKESNLIGEEVKNVKEVKEIKDNKVVKKKNKKEKIKKKINTHKEK